MIIRNIIRRQKKRNTKISYLGSGNGPYFEVVRAHKDVGKALADVAQDPFVKVLGLVGRRSDARFKGRVEQILHASGLLFFGQKRNVVLERVGNPLVLESHVGDALMLEPVICLGESLVQNVVKVAIVREDDVAANIVELYSLLVGYVARRVVQFTYEALRGDISRC